jgi:protein MpaA
LEDPRDVALSPGDAPGSEPETRALLELIRELEPEQVVALHAPLACIDDPHHSPLAQWLAERTGLPLVEDVGYPTPGSFGTWGAEQGLPVVTYEFPLATTDALVRQHVPVLVELLTTRRP